MKHLPDEHARALATLQTLLDETRWFPEYVFRGAWDRFFFFDSDWMFDAGFVAQAQTLLRMDGGSCVCVANFDRTVRTDDRLFFIDADTSPAAYLEVLDGKRVGEGWYNDIGRFGCCADASDWCIYAERACEIGVFAIRSAAQVERYRPVLSKFHALPIAEAMDIADPLPWGFEVLNPHWRGALLEHYE